MAKTCGGFMFGTTPILGVVVESQNSDSGPQYNAEAKNDKGETVAIQLGKATGTCSISGYKLSSTATPSINSKVSLNGKEFFVDKVTVTKTNTDFQKLEITGKFWDGVTTVC